MAKKKMLTVKSVHYVHTADIDPEATKAWGDAWEVFVNVCVKRPRKHSKRHRTGTPRINGTR